MNMKRRFIIHSMLSLLLLPIAARAEQFCLLLAENYYEQLYCEVKAQGQGNRLPSLYDFKNNNELTQAFLLKRPAARLGVHVVIPKKPDISKQSTYIKKGAASSGLSLTSSSLNKSVPRSPSGDENADRQSGMSSDDLARCLFQSSHIVCGRERFALMGNLKNNKLAEGVLEPGNRMNIPVYQGSEHDSASLDRYLVAAYAQYIEKMLEIGLGGSTFSYGKFVYLYRDVTAKGIDFSGRFETMFGYLKQDKKNLAVSENLPSNPSLDTKHCGRLVDDLLVCDRGQKNYLYRRQ
jgi:hypothetical protein